MQCELKIALNGDGEMLNPLSSNMLKITQHCELLTIFHEKKQKKNHTVLNFSLSIIH